MERTLVDPPRYDTGEDATDTHSWATDTEYDRAQALRWALPDSDHDHGQTGSCSVCWDAAEMNDHELLVKYQGAIK